MLLWRPRTRSQAKDMQPTPNGRLSGCSYSRSYRAKPHKAVTAQSPGHVAEDLMRDGMKGQKLDPK